MNEAPVVARVALHGFPDLGLAGGARPFLMLELPAQALTGRGIIKAMLVRFGEHALPFLIAACSAGAHPANVHLFVGEQAIGDLDVDLADRLDAEHRIEALLIRVKTIVGG
ncbi:MAG TPA: hypothetical protein PKZ77_00095 [Pseudomonadales bacterium]|nr:hypothetical protein [Pseudomonadales bacterium]